MDILGMSKVVYSWSKVSLAAQQIAPAKARRRAKMKAIVKIIHIRQFVLLLIPR